MKIDMSGAGAILAAMTTLRDLGAGDRDRLPDVHGQHAVRDRHPLGDVLTIRGGTTVEVVNADAEGRLVMADALVLAVEDGADAIVTIATLTGAVMRTFGTEVARCSATTGRWSTSSWPPATQSTSPSGSCRWSVGTAPVARRSPT